MNDSVFAQLSTLGSSLVLLFGITLLWRRSIRAYASAFQWQSAALSALFVVVGYFGREEELYGVAAAFFVLKVLVIPHYLKQLKEHVGPTDELEPYLNVGSSLVAVGVLVLLAYVIARPLVLASALPTRGGLPLAMGLIFVGLFVVVTRREALTQIVGYLVMENGIAMMAVLGTFGVPLIIELGVFLDVLMSFLVMQVFVYHIHTTFDSLDVQQLSQLRH